MGVTATAVIKRIIIVSYEYLILLPALEFLKTISNTSITQHLICGLTEPIIKLNEINTDLILVVNINSMVCGIARVYIIDLRVQCWTPAFIKYNSMIDTLIGLNRIRCSAISTKYTRLGY